MDAGDFEDIGGRISRHWELENSGTDAETILRYLSGKLEWLLSHDFETLVNLMYRLDVREQDFQEALQKPTEKDRARALAEIVLQREITRQQFRKKYSGR